MKTILTITGSDTTGSTGVQADIRTVSALGGHAVTAITSISVQDTDGILHIYDLPSDVVMAQVMTVITDRRPQSVKVGMVRDVDVIAKISSEIVGCHNIVLAPGMFSSYGSRLMTEQSISAWKKYLIPQAKLLQLRCVEAEAFLGIAIQTDEDMISAAKDFCDLGAEYVLLRGGHHTEGMLTALLYGADECRFFSSRNTSGWQKHGVGGALSTAIATGLAQGDDVIKAIDRAHTYMHSQIVNSISSMSMNRRPADIYNQFMSLIADNYTQAHDVAFYADRLSITTRYLSKVTYMVIAKTPKQLIAEYIVNESKALLRTTRSPIQHISNKLGFSSQARFCAFFSSQTGYSPSDWRYMDISDY